MSKPLHSHLDGSREGAARLRSGSMDISRVRSQARVSDVVRSTYSKYYIIEEHDLVKVLASLRELLQRLEHQVPQLRKIGNTPQFFRAS